MRILHLLASPVFSGPAENISLLASAQRALGHHVSVAIDRKREQLADEEPLRPRLEALKLLDGAGLELSVKSLPWAWLRDIRRLQSQPVDIVHSHFSHDHLIAKFGRPKGAALIRSVHAPRSLKRLPAADGYTVSTEQEARLLPRAPHRIFKALLADGLEPPSNRAALRAELSLDGAPLIGMVSHFQPSRRHDLGLRAFAELRRISKGARLVLVGDGPLRPTLQSLARTLSIQSQVTFVGYQSGAQFIRYLQALDVVWLLGLGNDHTARAARHARACGVRVVGIDEGALPTWADITVPQTAEAIAVATTELAPRAVSEPTTELAPRAVSEPTNEAIAHDILSLYEEASAARKARRR